MKRDFLLDGRELDHIDLIRLRTVSIILDAAVKFKVTNSLIIVIAEISRQCTGW